MNGTQFLKVFWVYISMLYAALGCFEFMLFPAIIILPLNKILSIAVTTKIRF